jgi:photosystem II stability/assembly factor-like uncharacterized protein
MNWLRIYSGCPDGYALKVKGGWMKLLVVICISFACGLTMFAATKNFAASQSLADLPEGGVVIPTPLDQYAWRVWPGGKIEYSFDNSRTWETQKSGVTVDLVGGFAPSDKVCWVLGRGGTILLTTDRGKHWKKISSPVKEGLAGVFAQDGKRASIWTASHKQSFETNDGGATWTANDSK